MNGKTQNGRVGVRVKSAQGKEVNPGKGGLKIHQLQYFSTQDDFGVGEVVESEGGSLVWIF